LDNVVTFSRLLSFGLVGIALVITVPLKLRNFAAAQQTLNQNLEKASATMLARKGFNIKIADRVGFVVNAQKDDCQLQIRKAAIAGFNLDAIRADAPKGAQLAFAYQGKLWTSHPRFRATLSEIWNRLTWQLGVGGSWSPVISVAALGPCAIEKLPWSELASIHAN
jgi:hypothetical protein